MKIISVLMFCLIGNLIYCQNNIKTISRAPIQIGESVQIRSEILDEDRILNIYLPENYTESNADQYPVIYLLDGGMDEDFIHIVGLVQFASFSWINMIPPSIVVGIKNVDRRRDFTFPTTITQDLNDFPTSGHSEKFIQFIEKELQPYIENNYRSSGKRTIIGQSLGGLLATEILFKKPQLFDQYIIISPSLWWDNQSLLDVKQSPREPLPVFVGVGKEGKIMKSDAKSLFKKQKSLGDITGFKYLKEQDHGDALHLAVYEAFEFFKVQ